MAPVPRVVKLLDANTTAVYGPWVPIANAVPDSIMIHTVGLVGADRVQIFQSSQDTPTTAEQVQFSSDIAADGLLEMTTPSAYIRAYRSVITGAGTITVTMSYTEDI